MKKAITKLASALFLGLLVLGANDAFAGCNDPAACNFVSTDTDILDCLYVGNACDDLDPLTINDVIDATCTCVGEAIVPGCTNPVACNFDPLANQDDGSCDLGLNINVGGGSFDSEISWSVLDEFGGLVTSGGAPASVDACLADGCYQMVMNDSFGDGWNGATYTITDNNTGGVIQTGTLPCCLTTGTDWFFIAADPTSLPCFDPGCTDPIACNYSPTANFDDGSCEYLTCAGCTDDGLQPGSPFPGIAACNYDPLATIEDGSCDYSCIGCTDPLACNFFGATVDDGSCCLDNCLTMDMFDSFGDGWDNGTYTITDHNTGLVVASGSLATGAAGTDELCLVAGCYDVFVGGSIFDSEISWTLTGGDAGPISGVSPDGPYTFQVAGGACEGCDDSVACNFDPLATSDPNLTCCYDNCLTLTVANSIFGSEISWDLQDEFGVSIVAGVHPATVELCLVDGCYNMVMNDSFGDGWDNGTYVFTDELGTVVAEGTLAAGATGTDLIAFGGTVGCTDPGANNYDPSAICDDGSCITCAVGEQLLSINMTDTFGDGWNGATYILTDNDSGAILASGSLDTAASGDGSSVGTDAICLADGCYGIEVTGGTFPGEVGWDVTDQLGTVIFSGTAPSGAPFGPAGFPLGNPVPACVIDGCTDPACNNYNPYATNDDGSCICPPANDDCVSAELIFCGNQVSGTTILSNDDEGLVGTTCGETVTSPGVWYVFDGTGDQVFLSTCNTVSGFDTKVHVYEGAPDCTNLVCIGGNDDGVCGSFLSEFSFVSTPGTDYYIRVSGFGTSTGDFILNVDCVDCTGAIPSNDDCATALFQPFGVQFIGSTCCAGPDPTDLCAPAFSTQYGVWFTQNSGICDTFDFELNNLTGGSVGMSIYVDSGNLGCGNITEIACCGPITGTCAGDLSAFYTIEPNTDYYFMVYTTDPVNCGDFSFTTQCGILGCTDPNADNYDSTATLPDPNDPCIYGCGVPPANQNCAGAIALPCNSQQSGSLGCADASDAPLLVTGCNSSPGAGVWYSFTGDGSLHTIRTCNGTAFELSAADTQIDIYTGPCGGPYACAQDAISGAFLSEVDDASAGSGCGFFEADDVYLEFVSAPGTDYLIYVSGSFGVDAGFTIIHDCVPAVLGCTVSCACNYNSLANVDDGTCDFFSCLCAACVPGPGTGVNMNMQDSFGDGWNNATYELTTGAGALIASGSLDTACDFTDIDNFQGPEFGDDWFCICDDGCYVLTVGGGDWDSEISFTLSDEGGAILAAGGAGTYNFQIGAVVCGCTDPIACNYNSLATNEDGSCEYLTCAGCTDPLACNFDGTATLDDGSCCFDNCVQFQMTDAFGDGWDTGTYEIYEAAGGTLVASGTLATGAFGVDDLCLVDGCYYVMVGGSIFDSEISWLVIGANGPASGGSPAGPVYFDVGAGTCFACTEPLACNYDPVPPLSDCTLCEYTSCLGCTYADAPEYNSLATIDDGTCTCAASNPCPTDLNGDGITNTQDLLIFLGQFGQPC